MHKFKIYDPDFLPHFGCDVEFNLAKGEGIVIVGENGIGKTTLIQKLWKERSEEIVLIEQKALDYFYDRTLFDLKKLLIEVRGKEIDKARFESLWEMMGLKGKENRKLSTLSGGENQSLKICVSLLKQSEVYFFDEPSQFLDQEKKQNLSKLISELLSQKKSVVIVEHDISWLPKNMNVIQLAAISNTVQRTNSWTT